MDSYPWLSEFLADARATVAPPRGAKDGVLPPLLVGLTMVTGLVDAFSYLVLGHVFVANMTGNVVFFAFALAGVAEAVTMAAVAVIAAAGARVPGTPAVSNPHFPAGPTPHSPAGPTPHFPAGPTPHSPAP